MTATRFAEGQLRPGTAESSDESALGDDAATARQRTLDALEDLLASAAVLDGATGEALPQTRSSFLRGMLRHSTGGVRPICLNSLLRQTRVLTEAVEDILRTPTRKLARVHLVQPLHKVRELDVRCLRALARVPGRNVREKLGASMEALGVVRRPSVDRTENRLLIRVAKELVPLLCTALAGAPADDEHAANRERSESLKRGIRVLTKELAQSDLATLPPASRGLPNNVLLSDPRYQRVWRAWHWLLTRRERELARRELGAMAIAHALLNLTFARLRQYDGAHGEERVIVPRLGDDSSSLSTQIDDQPMWVTLPGDDRAVLIVCECADSHTIEVSRYEFFGDHRMTPELVDILSCRLEVAEKSATANRGLPLKATIESAGGPIEEFSTHVDLDGLSQVSRDLSRRILDTGAERMTTPALRWSQTAIDVSGPVLLSDPPPATRIPLIAAKVTATISDHWCVGTSARDLELGWGASERVSQIPMADVHEALRASPSDDIATALRKMLEDALGNPEPRSIAVVAAFDDDDDIAFSTLSRAIPPAVDTTWIVWRSVLAAMHWRQSTPGIAQALAENDLTVVVDLDAPAPAVVCLAGRREPEPEGWPRAEPWDGWYWERPCPAVLDCAANPTSWQYDLALRHSQLSRAFPGMARDEIARYSRQLAFGGWNQGRTNSVVPLGSGRPEERIWLRLEPPALARADAQGRFSEDFSIWMSAFVHGDFLRSLKERDGTLRMLLIGRILGYPEIRDDIARVSAAIAPQICLIVTADPERCVVRGGSEFLRRRQANLPTYVDYVPDLFLEVATDRGHRRLLQVFKGRNVRPGEPIGYKVPEEIKLRPGKPYYSFPLSRSAEGSKRLSYDARLESPSFPLPDLTAARIEVSFRYGQDAFRVRVEPSTAGAFESLEIQWRRHDTAAVEIRNDPPDFPEFRDWIVSQTELDRLSTMTEAWTTEVERLFGRAVYAHQCARARNGEYARQILRDVRQLEQGCREIRSSIRTIWRPQLNPLQCPGELTQMLRPLVNCAAQLAGLEPAGERTLAKRAATGGGMPPSLQRPIEQVALRTREMLACLRWHAPKGLFSLLLEDAEQGWHAEVVHALARASASDPENASTLATSMLAACQQTLSTGRPNKLAPALWAMAMSLWEDRDIVGSYVDIAPVVVKACEDTLRRILEEWQGAGICADLKQHVATILLALTRLRGTRSGDLLQAGNELTRRLASLLEAADNSTRLRSSPRASRLRLDGDLTAEGFCSEVAAVLRGERIIRVLALDDEDEA